MSQTPATAQRKRERRTLYANQTDILDEFDITAKVLTLDELCDVFDVGRKSVQYLLRSHRDELLEDGWNPEDGGTFTRRAIMRVAMMMRPSTSALAHAITARAGARYEPIKFDAGGNNGAHASRCSALVERAKDIAVRVHDEDPADTWAELNALDRYTLQGLVVAIAAMVQVDQRDNLEWVGQLATFGKRSAPSSIPSGMTRLIPPPQGAMVPGDDDEAAA